MAKGETDSKLVRKIMLVVDNAPYHNLQVDKCPSQSSRKADIQAWLRRLGIPFSEGLLKAELLQLCKTHKPAPIYILDSTLKQHGHDCLRLPAYHADLNAIELIWAQVKGEVARRNLSFKMSDVKHHIEDSLSSITPADWRACCEHVLKVEKEYWDRDVAVEDEIARLVIEVTSSDEATDTGNENEDYSDTDTAASQYDYYSDTDSPDEIS